MYRAETMKDTKGKKRGDSMSNIENKRNTRKAKTEERLNKPYGRNDLNDPHNPYRWEKLNSTYNLTNEINEFDEQKKDVTT